MGFKSLKPEAKTQVNRFSLTVGTSGNTTYILGQTFPAGEYTIEFSNGDTTYDIYAIGTDGTNVGYTNGVTLTANADINEIVVLGAADNEVITFENFSFSVVGGGTPVAPSSAGDVASAGAFITSVSVSSLPSLDDTTTITGGNFAADVQVFFTGQDSVELEAKSLTRNSSTELVATRPDALDATDSPYTVKVVNPGVTEPTGSSAHLLPNSVTAGANPSWVTAAAQEYNPSGAVSITLSATDADGTVSYSLQSGTLPGGLSLNGSTGEISGTPTTSDGDVNVFTIRATDEGGNFVDREFTFTALDPVLPLLSSAPLWLDASDASTITESGGSVSQWDNKGTLENFTQATSADQPTTGVSTLNGLNVIDFDNDFLAGSTKTQWTFMNDGTQYFTAAVVQYGVTSNPDAFMGLFGNRKGSGANVGVDYAMDDRSSQSRNNAMFVTIDSTDIPVEVIDNGFLTAGTPMVYSALADPNNGTPADRFAYFNNNTEGTLNNTNSASPTSTTPTFNLEIGNIGDANSALALKGKIAELIIVSGADATETNRQTVVDYLNTKWGVF